MFTEPRPYPLFRFPNRANPSLFIIFSLTKLSATVPSVTIHPPLPSIADCASVHEVRVAGLAPPPNSRRKGSSHRRATVQPSLRPPSRHRRATVAPPLCLPARHRHAASVAPWLRPLSCVRRALRRASVAPLCHGPPQPPLGELRCTAASCDCSGEYLAPRSPFPATVAPPILPGVNSKRGIFFLSFCIFFYDLGNCFAFWWGFWLIFALFFCYFYGLLFCELALVSRLRFNTKIMYCPRVFIWKKLHFFKIRYKGIHVHSSLQFVAKSLIL